MKPRIEAPVILFLTSPAVLELLEQSWQRINDRSHWLSSFAPPAQGRESVRALAAELDTIALRLQQVQDKLRDTAAEMHMPPPQRITLREVELAASTPLAARWAVLCFRVDEAIGTVDALWIWERLSDIERDQTTGKLTKLMSGFRRSVEEHFHRLREKKAA